MAKAPAFANLSFLVMWRNLPIYTTTDAFGECLFDGDDLREALNFSAEHEVYAPLKADQINVLDAYTMAILRPSAERSEADEFIGAAIVAAVYAAYLKVRGDGHDLADFIDPVHGYEQLLPPSLVWYSQNIMWSGEFAFDLPSRYSAQSHIAA